jgi:hypothetical protein
MLRSIGAFLLACLTVALLLGALGALTSLWSYRKDSSSVILYITSEGPTDTRLENLLGGVLLISAVFAVFTPIVTWFYRMYSRWLLFGKD